MSTNAVIRVDGLKVEIYKHWDGFPENTLPWLEKFNKEFASQRGDDPNYKFAQLLRSSARDGEQFGLDASPFTGWGVFPVETTHYDYLYILKADGTVKVVGEDGEDIEGADE